MPELPGGRPGNIPLAPAPWRLKGQAYIITLRLPREQLERDGFIPAGLRLASRSGIAYAMFVDYSQSDVGPYHELLFVPGKLWFGEERFPSVSRIFVSTWPSVVNGENNWGIPKDRCDFSVSYGEDGVDRIALTAGDGTRFAELELESWGLNLPGPGQLVPERFRTLAQLKDGKRYTYAPRFKGWFKLAKLRRWRFDSRYFPDLARGTVVSAVKLTSFDLTFPIARVTPL